MDTEIPERISGHSEAQQARRFTELLHSCPFLPSNHLEHAHRHTAVNHDVLSCNEVILDQVDNELRNVFGLAFSVQCDAIMNVIRAACSGVRQS